jgi:hypothetical protein
VVQAALAAEMGDFAMVDTIFAEASHDLLLSSLRM